MSEKPITNLEDAVAALGALPMPMGSSPLVPSEQQVEALVATGNRVVNDSVHEHLCACDAWPQKCVSTGNYFMGAWDVDGLEAALPAVLGLWEQMRGGELARLQARVAELEVARATVYRVVEGVTTVALYTTAEQARKHCEFLARREYRGDGAPELFWREGEDTVHLPEDGEAWLMEMSAPGFSRMTGFSIAPVRLSSLFVEVDQ